MTDADAKTLADANLDILVTLCRMNFSGNPKMDWEEVLGEAYLQARIRLRHYDATKSNVRTFLSPMVGDLRRSAYGRLSSPAQKQRGREHAFPEDFDLVDPKGDITYHEAEVRDLVARIRRTLAAYRGGALWKKWSEGDTQREIADHLGVDPSWVSLMLAEAKEAVLAVAA